MPFDTTEMLFYKLPPESVVFGQSEAMRAIWEKLDKISATNLPVLIQGESGTGKEVLARMIHERSPWSAGPFIKLSCPAIPLNLFDSQLLSGLQPLPAGVADPQAVIERGTLLLDEISELTPSLQVKLLQVLQDTHFLRINPRAGHALEGRIVCTTSSDLQPTTGGSGLRRELYYRLNVLHLHLPPLRERAEDIPALVSYLLEQHNRKYGGQVKVLSAHAMQMLQEHYWPGNLRELDNLLKRFVIIGSEDVIAAELLGTDRNRPLTMIPVDGTASLKKVTRQAVRDLERQIILRSLQANNWNRKRVARALSISYRALLYKIRDAGLSSARPERQAAAEQSRERAA